MPQYEPPQPGWWQASDGNWYPPESHPDHRRSTQPPPPLPPPGPPRSGTQVSGTQSSGTRRWLLGGIGLVAILGIIGAVAAGNAEEDNEQANSAQLVEANVDDDRSDDQDDSSAGSSAGSNPDPLAFGSLVPVVFDSFGDADGSVWNVRVTEPQDIGAAVLAANPFNDAPPAGIVYAGFEVEMTLARAGKEPLSPGFNFSWEVLGGSTSAVYNSTTIDGILGCGVLDAEFDNYSEVFVGGTLSGTVCIPIPAADLADAGTQVAMNFSGDRVIFNSSGASPPPAEVAEAGHATAAGAERALGVLVPIELDTFGDADGSVWNVIVSPLRDLTVEVRDAYRFNDEAPDGVVFAGFDLQMTLASAGKVPLSTAFNVKWEILGGATSSVYDTNTVVDIFGCGVTGKDFNEVAQVFVGGTVAGTVCIPLPTGDLAHADTHIALNINGERILFLPDGPTPEAAPIDAGGGPASMSEPRLTGVPTEIAWDSIGDANRSVWTTTVHDLRDITAEVLAANPFNDAPPAGVAWLGFDVEMTLVESFKEPLSAGFNFQWEVLGGQTRRVYNPITFSGIIGCGIVDDDFDHYAEVFNGGTLSGTICIPVPLADLGHPDTRISMQFDDTRITFRPS